MQIPNISLAYQVAELKPLIDLSILRKVQELENGWLKFKFQTRHGTKDLIAAPSALFITSFSMPARQTTSGYGAFLRKKLVNKRVKAIGQKGFDRVVVLEFDGFFLIFELFAKGNVILTDENKVILSAFRKEQWKDRALRKGEQYKFPSSKGINPKELDAKKLGEMLKESGIGLVRTLVKEVNIAPVFAEEACVKAGLDKGAIALGEKDAKKAVKAVKELYSVDLKQEKPVVVEKEGKEILLPFPSRLKDLKPKGEFPSINQALDSFYSRQFSKAGDKPEVQAQNRKKKELEKSMQRQKEALEMLQLKIRENAEKAEIIYSRHPTLFKLTQEIKSLGIEKLKEKEVMYKLKRNFPCLKSVDVRNRKIVVSLEN